MGRRRRRRSQRPCVHSTTRSSATLLDRSHRGASTGSVGAVETDVLGLPYEQRRINLPADTEGEVVATLVRARAGSPTNRAVLYLHGYVDYFFQTHLAEFY